MDWLNRHTKAVDRMTLLSAETLRDRKEVAARKAVQEYLKPQSAMGNLAEFMEAVAARFPNFAKVTDQIDDLQRQNLQDQMQRQYQAMQATQLPPCAHQNRRFDYHADATHCLDCGKRVTAVEAREIALAQVDAARKEVAERQKAMPMFTREGAKEAADYYWRKHALRVADACCAVDGCKINGPHIHGLLPNK